MKSDLDESRLQRIWRHEIGPYLEDHFLDDPERLQEFDLTTLRASLAPNGPSITAAPADRSAGGVPADDDASPA